EPGGAAGLGRGGPRRADERGGASRRASQGRSGSRSRRRGESVARRCWMLALAGLGAGCAWGGHNGTRLLPADRGGGVMYVALGDSTVEGVGASSPERNYVSRVYARLRSVYPDARLANLGVGGATSAHGLV